MLRLLIIFFPTLAFAGGARVDAVSNLAREALNFSDTFRLVRVLMLGSAGNELSPRLKSRVTELEGRRYYTVAEGPTGKLQFSEPISGIADHQTPSNLLEALLYARIYARGEDRGLDFNATAPVLNRMLDIKEQARATHSMHQYHLAWTDALRERLMRSYVGTDDIGLFRLWAEAETSRWRARRTDRPVPIDPQSVGALERDALLRLAQPGRARHRFAVFNLALVTFAQQLEHDLGQSAPDWSNARAIGVYARTLLSFGELTRAHFSAVAEFESPFVQLARALLPDVLQIVNLVPTFDETLPAIDPAAANARALLMTAVRLREAIVNSAYYRALTSPDRLAPVCEFQLY